MNVRIAYCVLYWYVSRHDYMYNTSVCEALGRERGASTVSMRSKMLGHIDVYANRHLYSHRYLPVGCSTYIRRFGLARLAVLRHGYVTTRSDSDTMARRLYPHNTVCECMQVCQHVYAPTGSTGPTASPPTWHCQIKPILAT